MDDDADDDFQRTNTTHMVLLLRENQRESNYDVKRSGRSRKIFYLEVKNIIMMCYQSMILIRCWFDIYYNNITRAAPPPSLPPPAQNILQKGSKRR